MYLVFVEGKFDYYTFKWIRDVYFSDEGYDFRFYPGAGVDNYEQIFREYLGNGKKFIAVFDDDNLGGQGGIGARTHYIENVSQELENNIFTLKNAKESFSDYETEHLFGTDAERLRIQKVIFPEELEYEKGKFNTAVQHMFIKNENFQLLDTTKKNFKVVFDFMQEKLDKLN